MSDFKDEDYEYVGRVKAVNSKESSHFRVRTFEDLLDIQLSTRNAHISVQFMTFDVAVEFSERLLQAAKAAFPHTYGITRPKVSEETLSSIEEAIKAIREASKVVE